MSLLYHVNMYLEFLILACTIYILAPSGVRGIIKNEKYKGDLLLQKTKRGFAKKSKALEWERNFKLKEDQWC